jgi:hypothetical protein
MKIKLVACAGLLAMAFAIPAASEEAKAFEPWAIQFDNQNLAVLVVSYRDGSARTFYYLPFTISNNRKVPAQLGLHIVAHVGTDPKKAHTHIALPHPDAELFYKRMARSKDIKNVQEINAMKELAPGQSVKGIAVFGTFDREWDKATVAVTGLEPRAIPTRVRQYGSDGFTMAHRAYNRHNEAVKKKAGADASYTEPFVVVKHLVALRLGFHREGDEFAPQLDPIYPDFVEWDVLDEPGPEVVLVKTLPFAK